MDKKQEIINEYFIGAIGYRTLSKKYSISRSTINRWVMDYEGRNRSKSRELKVVNLPLMKQADSKENLPQEVEELQKQLVKERLHNNNFTKFLFFLLNRY
jgi:transposase-like protein